MKINKKSTIFMAALLTLALTGCQKKTELTSGSTTEKRDVMYQAETLQSLMLGNYYGFVSMEDVKKNGDIGLGTFTAVDGEMIVLDGVVYQAKGDGSVVVAEDTVQSPFCSVTWFDEDKTCKLTEVTSLDDLKQKMTECIKDNPNIMYAVKIHSTFDSVTARSEIAQEEPYKDLNTALQTDQRVFPEQKQVTGTVVAVYFPAYMEGINTPGWHFHFISDDHKFGGHIMNIAFAEASVQIDGTSEFHMAIPEDEHFSGLNLTTDLKDAISSVEGGK